MDTKVFFGHIMIVQNSEKQLAVEQKYDLQRKRGKGCFIFRSYRGI